jgi:parallel beta-helix repeat protein
MNIYKLLFKAQISIFFIVLLFSLYSACWAANYYVDVTNGNDSNNGLSETTAWKTIAKVNASKFNPGDQILFKRGNVWREQLTIPSSGAAGQPVIFGAYGSGDKPVIKSFPVRVVGKDFVIIENIKLSGSNYSAIFINNISRTGNHELRNLTIEACAGNGVTIHSSNNNTIEFCTISNVGRHGIQLHLNDSSVKATGNVFSNNVIHNASGRGMSIDGYSDTARIKSNSAYRNTIYSCGDGIYLTYADNNKIFDNTLYSNNNTKSAGEGYGVGVCSSSNNKIYENKIHNNRTRGIEVWGGATPWGRSDGNKIYRNEIYSHIGSNVFGIFFSSAYSNNNEVFNNIVRENQSGIVIGHVNSGNKLFNNTFYGNIGNALSFYNNAAGWDLKNNIFSGNGQYALNAPANTKITHTHNLYFKLKGDVVKYNNIVYSLPNITSFEPTAIGVNPNFTNPSNKDFHLQANSPCIDRGVNVGLTHDFYGTPVPRGKGFDVGAIEYKRHIEVPGK